MTLQHRSLRLRAVSEILAGLLSVQLLSACAGGAERVTGSSTQPAASPLHLQIQSQPSSSIDGGVLPMPIIAAVQDGSGKTISSASGTVTISLDSGAAVLIGTATAPLANGVVTFDSLTLRGTGQVFLRLTASGLGSARTSSLSLFSKRVLLDSVATAGTAIKGTVDDSAHVSLPASFATSLDSGKVIAGMIDSVAVLRTVLGQTISGGAVHLRTAPASLRALGIKGRGSGQQSLSLSASIIGGQVRASYRVATRHAPPIAGEALNVSPGEISWTDDASGVVAKLSGLSISFDHTLSTTHDWDTVDGYLRQYNATLDGQFALQGTLSLELPLSGTVWASKRFSLLKKLFSVTSPIFQVVIPSVPPLYLPTQLQLDLGVELTGGFNAPGKVEVPITITYPIHLNSALVRTDGTLIPYGLTSSGSSAGPVSTAAIATFSLPDGMDGRFGVTINGKIKVYEALAMTADLSPGLGVSAALEQAAPTLDVQTYADVQASLGAESCCLCLGRHSW